jgi:hypothetical protein
MDARTLSLLFAPSWLLFTPGCLHESAVAFEPEETTAEPAPPPGQDTELELANDTPAADDAPRGEQTPPAYPVSIPGREWHFFALGAGYGALGQIDLSPCREEGLPPGYWHVRVTFGPSGRIVHASVESPVAPSREALACISDKLTSPTVPRFDGHGVTLSKSIFVATADPPRTPDKLEIDARDRSDSATSTGAPSE